MTGQPPGTKVLAFAELPSFGVRNEVDAVACHDCEAPGPTSVRNHAAMLDHYQQTKNLLVSYSPKKLGLF